MKKKSLAILLTVIFVIAMMATGCSGASDKETDSGEAKTETETEAAAEDDQQAAEEDSEVVTTEEDEISTEEDVVEITEPKLTGSTPFTDEDFSEMCESIKKSITDEYLQPNNISAEEFAWPAADSQSWEYLTDISGGFLLPISIEEFDSICEERESNYESLPENKIMQAVMHGIINWLNDKGGCDDTYYPTVIMHFLPFSETLPSEISF